MRHPGRLGELLEQFGLFGAQLFRDGNLGGHQHVAPALALRDPLPLDAELPARLGAGRNLEQDFLSVQRLDPEPGAERRLGQIDGHVADEVETVPAEKAVGLYLKGDQQVTRGLSAAARSEERREGKSVDLGGRRIIKKKKRDKQR